MGFYLQRIRNVQPSKAEEWWEMWHILNSQYLLIHTWYLWNFLKLKNITSRKTLWTFEISEDVAAFFEKPNANDTTNVSVST